MRLRRIKSSSIETTEPTFLENISLVVCPFLGLDEDPGTSLGFSHAANHCHRLEKPVGIDLAHQNRFCLCDNYTNCYVYGQSRSQPEEVKTTEAVPSLPPDDSALGLNERSPKKRGLRVAALMAMLLLIVLAVIIWWPPPGTILQDVIVLGASITEDKIAAEGAILEVSASSEASSEMEQALSENNDALVGESAELAVNPVESKPSGKNAPAEAEESDTAVDEQKNSADAALASSDTKAIAPVESTAAEAKDSSEFDNPAEDFAALVSETAVLDEEDAAREELVDIGEEDSMQASERQITAPEEDSQIDSEESDEQEPVDVSSSESDSAGSTSVDSKPSGSPSAVTMTHIGPIASAAGLQGTSEPAPLLFLLRHPGDGAEVLAMIPERQTATVLGRNSSGEWLLVRLASGVEGWVHADESGASVITSKLPIKDDVSGEVPIAQEPDPIPVPTAAAQDPAPAISSSPAVGTAIINSGALNLRSGPGLEYEKVGIAYNGQQIWLLEQLGNQVWVQVRLADGTQGWVNSNYLIQIRWAEG